MSVTRYNFKYGPRNKSPLYEDPAGCMVRTVDYDALAAKVRQLLDADKAGVIMASDKTGTWNYLQELKRMVGWQPDADAENT